MTFDFDTFPDRRQTESTKWNYYDPDVLPMWVADMDFLSPPAVLDALQARITHGVFGYPVPPAGLKENIVSWLAHRHDWQVHVDDLVFVPGVVVGFNLAAHAVTRPGDGLVIQTPTYGPFFNVAENVKLVQQEMELNRDHQGQYQVDLDAFKATLTGRSRLFMLCNPQNPTGRVFRRDELEAMAEICLENELIICSDEIHSDLVYSGHKHIPVAALAPEIADQTITLLAPSKTFNIAGLKASIAVITNPKLRKRFQAAQQGLVGSVNLLAMVAMQAAYEQGEPWLEALLQYLQANRDYLSDYVQENLPGVRLAQPESTYLAWLDCQEAGIDGQASEFFLKQARVAMNAGEWFGKGGAGFVRLNFGCPRSMLADSLARLQTALTSRPAQQPST
ncbi:MAG: pyridoxal phosphate-dependent aminotransferase [Anaerolineales bacterium]|nr:pyridoxal phosphate-dependent aminotransferase [Anaerolineales bacterium]